MRTCLSRVLVTRHPLLNTTNSTNFGAGSYQHRIHNPCVKPSAALNNHSAVGDRAIGLPQVVYATLGVGFTALLQRRLVDLNLHNYYR